MNTSERLRGYYPFGQDILDQVSLVAEQQASMDYESFFASCEIQETVKPNYDGYAPVEILDINPDGSEEKPALMVHLPMANPLDPNNLYQIATLSASLPDTRIIASGNPTKGYPYGGLNRKQRGQVSRGDFRPTVEPLMKYAEANELSEIHQVGYSYGADKAVTAANTDAYVVDKLVVIEPASVFGRNVLKLAMDFGSSAKHLKKYVEANELSAFIAARKDSVGAMDYNLGLTKLTNIAVARGLSDGMFEQRLHKATDRQIAMSATLAWGTKSELALDEEMNRIAFSTWLKYGAERIHALKLIDQTHALPNDLHLQAAVVLTGLR